MPHRTLLLFNHDWDAIGHARAAAARGLACDEAGFDLFSFPSNARLAWFDMERWVQRLARRARARGWTAVSSQHEQFGALAAALLAERMGWPGTPVAAILACQHKFHAREVLQRVAPEANVPFELMQAAYGEPVPDGLRYPLFVKPVKAAFSVLAREIRSREELHRHTRFGAWELWVIRRLVEPFERLAQQRQAVLRRFPDALLLPFPKSAGAVARDFKWLGSYRYGIVHLGGRDAADLRQRCEVASAALGWPAPCCALPAAAPQPVNRSPALEPAR